jgi:hypothetical protein
MSKKYFEKKTYFLLHIGSHCRKEQDLEIK